MWPLVELLLGEKVDELNINELLLFRVLFETDALGRSQSHSPTAALLCVGRPGIDWRCGVRLVVKFIFVATSGTTTPEVSSLPT